MLRVFCYLFAYIFISVFRLVCGFLSTFQGLVTIVLLACFFTYVWPSIINLLKVPYPQTVTVITAVINGRMLPSEKLPGEHWFDLTMLSTYERPYKAMAAICSIKGPVYYSNQYGGLYSFVGASEGYIGERRLLVTLFPASWTKLSEPDYYSPALLPVERDWIGIGKPHPSPEEVLYFSTTPADWIGMLDRVQWCEVGEDRAVVAKQLGVTLSEHGTIVGDRVTWIGPHGDFPVDQLVDRRVGSKLLGMVRIVTPVAR